TIRRGSGAMKIHAPAKVVALHRMRDRAFVRPLGRFLTALTRTVGLGLALGLGLATTTTGHAAGTLTPKGSPDQPIQIRDHHLEVILDNGFARPEVTQTFYNPNEKDLEAVYRFPLPKSASLSEVTMTLGEREIQGEVVEKEKAQTIYQNEKSGGN